MPEPREARRWVVSGRVQGVGFRYFVVHAATALGLRGYTSNLDDGSVEVYASGTAASLDALAGYLHTGPRMSMVRSVEQQEAPMVEYGGFTIRS